MRILTSALVIALTSFQLRAQTVIKLQANTLADFETYAAKVETSLAKRWSGQGHFLEVEDTGKNQSRCLQGKLFIEQMEKGQSAQIPGGLIHDWVGTVYIPNSTIVRVLAILENFDNHDKIYPEVAESRNLERDGHKVLGYWRLHQKGLIPVTFDVEQQVSYQQVSPGKWKGQAYARKIIETDTALFAKGRKFPQDEGHGYLWRLYSYWSLEARDGGVLAECRTISLSRDIPAGLGWAIGPYVKKVPENSLATTLEQTRKAVKGE